MRSCLVCAAAGAMVATVTAQKVLVPKEPYTVNGGTFTLAPNRVRATGGIDPFLRLEGNDLESGYNTSARPLKYPNADSIWTRNLQLGELRKDTAPGVPANAFVFDFDLSEGTGGTVPLIGLRDLKIWVNPQPDLNYTTLSDFGTPVYDLGGLLNSVILTDGVAAAGEPDAEFRLPAEAIRNVPGIQSSDYVYLYVEFFAAEGDPAEDLGFEQVSLDVGNLSEVETFDIPEPRAYALLAGLGLIGLGVLRRLRR